MATRKGHLKFAAFPRIIVTTTPVLGSAYIDLLFSEKSTCTLQPLILTPELNFYNHFRSPLNMDPYQQHLFNQQAYQAGGQPI